MSVQVRRRSRLRFADLVNVDGFEFWNMLEPPTLLSQADDLHYQVQVGDRIDLLAFKFYGDPILWWVIALANDMELLPTDLNYGDTLLIPSPRYILQVIFQNSKN